MHIIRRSFLVVLPIAFMRLDDFEDSPLYSRSTGLFLVFAFTTALGYGSTKAEPALSALGITVERLTHVVKYNVITPQRLRKGLSRSPTVSPTRLRRSG